MALIREGATATQDWGRRRVGGSPVPTQGVVRESGQGIKPGYGREGLYASKTTDAT